MTKAIETLIKRLRASGITFEETSASETNVPTDRFKKLYEPIANVVFKKGTEELKISHNLFFRRSGMCRIMKEMMDGGEIKFVPLTDEDFYNGVLRTHIEFYFLEIEKKNLVDATSVG